MLQNLVEKLDGETLKMPNSYWMTLAAVGLVAGVGELNKRRKLMPGQQRPIQMQLPFEARMPRSWNW